jgi:2-iminobutanoate/2-iminopropanoate deaminase
VINNSFVFCEDRSMPRTAFTSPNAATAGPYSHAVAAHGLVYLSGQTPIDPATGQLVQGSVADQTHRCLANLFAVLDGVGLSGDDVIKVQVYLTDMNDFPEMNRVYAEYFTPPYPARTTIGVASLPLGARIEIGMIAATPD